MKHDPMLSGKRRSVNMTIDAGVIAAARSAGVNLSQISEAALRQAARAALDEQWQKDNRAWIDAHREWVEAHPLPLEGYRMF